MPYPRAHHQRPADADPIPSQPSFPRLEEDTLAYWDADDTFRASVEAREAGVRGSNEFVFYDGPPFANGLPHYGHLLTGYVKDLVPRYHTMRGRRVERRFGWDCHGLPAEVEAEKGLGISHKSEIEDMGVAAFNDACRASARRNLRPSVSTTTYVTSGCTAAARLEGSVQGVVVHTRASAPASSGLFDSSRRPTVTAGSWRSR